MTTPDSTPVPTEVSPDDSITIELVVKRDPEAVSEHDYMVDSSSDDERVDEPTLIAILEAFLTTLKARNPQAQP